MAYKTDECWACKKIKPVDSHHIFPLEYGGNSDGKQVPLCSACHTIIHREAESYYKTGKYQGIEDVADSPNHVSHLKSLIKRINQIRSVFENGDTQQELNSHQRLTSAIHWGSEEERQMAHTVKTAMGFKSLERAMKALVFDKYERLRRKRML